jgi:hypothetical protein
MPRPALRVIPAWAGNAPQTRTAAIDAACAPLAPYVAALRRQLLAHPETPDAVGDAGADVVIGFEAACKPRN